MKSNKPQTIDTSNRGTDLGTSIAPLKGDGDAGVSNLDDLVSSVADQDKVWTGDKASGGRHSAATLGQYLKSRSHRPTMSSK